MGKVPRSTSNTYRAGLALAIELEIPDMLSIGEVSYSTRNTYSG